MTLKKDKKIKSPQLIKKHLDTYFFKNLIPKWPKKTQENKEPIIKKHWDTYFFKKFDPIKGKEVYLPTYP